MRGTFPVRLRRRSSLSSGYTDGFLWTVWRFSALSAGGQVGKGFRVRGRLGFLGEGTDSRLATAGFYHRLFRVLLSSPDPTASFVRLMNSFLASSILLVLSSPSRI